MASTKPVKVRTLNGVTYEAIPEEGCHGCVARNNLDLCHQLSECTKPSLVWQPVSSPEAIEALTTDQYIARIGTDTNAVQIGGDHYKSKGIQPWDYIAANDLDYFQGNVIKYVTRFREKNGIQDLEKAQHYLQKLIDIEKDKQ